MAFKYAGVYFVFCTNVTASKYWMRLKKGMEWKEDPGDGKEEGKEWRETRIIKAYYEKSILQS